MDKDLQEELANLSVKLGTAAEQFNAAIAIRNVEDQRAAICNALFALLLFVDAAIPQEHERGIAAPLPRLVEALLEVRRGNRDEIFEPNKRPRGGGHRTHLREKDFRLYVAAAIELCMSGDDKDSREDAGRRVARWMEARGYHDSSRDTARWLQVLAWRDDPGLKRRRMKTIVAAALEQHQSHKAAARTIIDLLPKNFPGKFKTTPAPVLKTSA